tara:strand:+ start:869 stop:1171 length:303 start_codon:yes stop_codon:yes gene_type:complete
MKEQAICSDHCYKRAKNHFKWNKSATERMADIALNNGITHSESKGRLSRFITKKWFKYKHANNVRIYGDNIYFFKDNLLITLYRVPNSLIRFIKYTKENA